MRNEILEYFRKANGNYVSGEQISRDLNVSRTAIWKHINILKSRGYIFESSTRKGYRLIYAPNLLTPLEIASVLHTETLGKKVVYFESTPSTNEEAKKIAREGCRGIRRLGLADAGIKWPNDILYHGKKLVGMLCEMSASMEKIDYIIMGIGINTGMKEKEFPEDFRGHATSFLNEGVNVSRRDLLAAVLAELEAEYKLAQTEGFGRVLDDWRKLSVTLGEEVRVIFGNDNYTGKAVDIDDDGCLLVDTGREVRRVMAGDVSIRPADAPIPQR